MTTKTKTKAEPTADQKYKELRENAEALLAAIRVDFKRHATKQAADPKNWGYVGDMGHAVESLERVCTFMAQHESR